MLVLQRYNSAVSQYKKGNRHSVLQRKDAAENEAGIRSLTGNIGLDLKLIGIVLALHIRGPDLIRSIT